MNLLFDFKLTNGDVLVGVHFIQYQIPVKSGIGSKIMMYVNDSLQCFKGEEKVTNINLLELELIRVYGEEAKLDVTEQFVRVVDTMHKFSSPFSMRSRSPFAREVIILD